MVSVLLLLLKQHVATLHAFLLVPMHLVAVIVLDQVSGVIYLPVFALTDLYSEELVVFISLIFETEAENHLEV